MIIVGASSAGKETSGIFMKQCSDDIIFFDDDAKCSDLIWNKFIVVKTEEKLVEKLTINPEFCIAIGNPRLRKKMFDRMIGLGGVPKNIIAQSYNSLSIIKETASILQPGVTISFDVKFGNSCFIHANTVIGHEVIIGDFVNISPLCSIVGPCKIGNETYIGASSIIYPNLKIGKNVFIPAGSRVNRDVKDFGTF